MKEIEVCEDNTKYAGEKSTMRPKSNKGPRCGCHVREQKDQASR